MKALTHSSASARKAGINITDHSTNGKTNPVFRLLGVLLITLSLTSCGFHLRGSIPLPESIQNIFVKAPDGTFKTALEDVLANAGATIAASEKASDATLVVTSAGTKRDVGTLDERGLANSYDITFTVRYTLVDAEQEVLRASSTVRERRRFDFDPSLVVETESEEMELQADMEREIALKIVRQLASYQPSAAGEEAESAAEGNADADASQAVDAPTEQLIHIKARAKAVAPEVSALAQVSVFSEYTDITIPACACE